MLVRDIKQDKNIKKIKQLKRNLFLITYNSDIMAIRYHQTDILRFYYDFRTKKRVIRINTGEYLTQTTKNHINAFIPGKLIQKNFKWYYINGNKAMPFYDNMIINYE